MKTLAVIWGSVYYFVISIAVVVVSSSSSSFTIQYVNRVQYHART